MPGPAVHRLDETAGLSLSLVKLISPESFATVRSCSKIIHLHRRARKVEVAGV
jgi:hypothetical protein